jgi:hypothetical protein
MNDMNDAQPQPDDAGDDHPDRDEAAAAPAGADPRRQHTDPEFDEDDEPEPPDPPEIGEIT